MQKIIRPAAIAAAAFVSVVSAGASVDLTSVKIVPMDNGEVSAPDLLVEKGWPYFDNQWTLRGQEVKSVSRVVFADAATQQTRNANLLDLAAKPVEAPVQ